MRVKYLERYDLFVNEAGKVSRFLESGKIKVYTPQLCRLGYVRIQATVNKQRKTLMAHRLVALAFIPNPSNKPDVNHKDSNKGNNHISNLEWVTESENTQHAMNREGLTPPGRPIINKDRDTAIYEEFLNGSTRTELCKKWNMARPNLSRVIRLCA